MSTLSSIASTLATPPTTATGLISGLDTTSIITNLLAVQQSQIDRIKSQETTVKTQQAAYAAIRGKLLTLQGTLTGLARSQNGVFDGRSATSSDESLVTVAASGSAVAGVYSLKVASLATAQVMASQGFDSANSAISQGTLQIQTGTGAATTITIDSSNATLQGLADVINRSGANVSASVINDGGAGQGYRLLLTSKGTGTQNRITITNNLAASSGGSIRPVFDQNSISNVILGSGFSGTSTPTSGGTYTGTTNNAYTFTVLNSGTVGTDDNIQLSYSDSTGTHTGTLTVNAADVGVAKDVAEGLQVNFGAGTVVAGQTFSIRTFVPTVQAAQDATVVLGSGAGALTVASSTNQIDGLIPGVTLKLNSADPGQTVAITVANDTDGVKKAITDFVSSYNDVLDLIDKQTAYDAATDTAAPLLGDGRVSRIEEQVRNAMTSVVVGANPRMNRLGALGITTDDNGQLQVDDTKLTNALNGSIAGVTLADVHSLFALFGQSSTPGFQFVTGSTRTQASDTPYTVQVTQAARQAAITAASAVASSVTIDGTNDTLALTLDGKSTSITLAHGTYAAAALVPLLQGAINGSTDLAGRTIAVALTGGRLSFTSNSFGSSSTVAIGAGSANAALGLAGTETDQGQNVIGSFLVNGVAESASGSGQFLLGDPTNAHTADLQVRVTLTAAQVGAGTQADLTVSRGLASLMDVSLSGLLDPVDGRLKSIDDGFNQLVTDYEKRAADQTDALNSQKARLQQEFATMEQTLAQLQSASSFLAVQSGNTSTKKN